MKEYGYLNILHYAKYYMYSFAQKPFNELDSAIFSWLSYLRIQDDTDNSYSKEGMPLYKLLRAENYESMFHELFDIEGTFDLMVAVISNPRFRDVKICFYRSEYDKEADLQFSAMTFKLPDSLYYVAYRGTDYTMTAWKEDLLLMLKNAIPAQKLSVKYLDKVASHLEGKFYVGGHSKGGNLAVYAASHCDLEVQNRILTVYSHDGPGFLHDELQNEGFKNIQSRIEKTIPQASYVGMLMENEVEPKVVESGETSILQHSVLSWKIVNDSFVSAQEPSMASRVIVKRVNEWLNGLNNEQRVIFIDCVFKILDDLKIEDVGDLGKDFPRLLPSIVASISKMDENHRRFMMDALHLIFFDDKDAKKRISSYEDLEKTIKEDEEIEFNEKYNMFL